MQKFMCTKKCYFNNRLFLIGDIYQGSKANDNFVPVQTARQPKLVEGQAMKLKSHEQPMSKQVPQPGAEIETVILEGREIDIEREKNLETEIERLQKENAALKETQKKPKKKGAPKKSKSESETVSDGQDEDMQPGA